MRKLSLIALMILLVIASCTKKAVPTVAGPQPQPQMDGAPIYAQNCARCHGATGTEGRAPNLAEGGHSKSDITDIVLNGGGRMPSFKDKLSDKEIDAVATFVLHLSK